MCDIIFNLSVIIGCGYFILKSIRNFVNKRIYVKGSIKLRDYEYNSCYINVFDINKKHILYKAFVMENNKFKPIFINSEYVSVVDFKNKIYKKKHMGVIECY